VSPIAPVALFGAGVASFLSPCVVPLLPVYVGMMASEAADGARHLARAAMCFVAGFSLVFVALGLLAGQAGSALDRFEGWIAGAGGAVLVMFGLLLLAVRRGRASRSLRFAHVRLPGGSVARPVVMGVVFGAAWTPCVGPLLGSALVLAADDRTAAGGAVLLAAYAAGLGAPFVAASLAIESSPSLPARLRRWSSRIEPIAAAGLIVLGVLVFTGWYRRAVGLTIG
jgi:cytochrome c-type biogenesis protein